MDWDFKTSWFFWVILLLFEASEVTKIGLRLKPNHHNHNNNQNQTTITKFYQVEFVETPDTLSM